MAAIPICSDFGTQKNSQPLFPLFPHLFAMKWWDLKMLWKYLLIHQSPSNQSNGFPAVMCGCESWTIKKAEHWRIDAFELWCWRRLESPLDNKEIKPVNPEGNQSRIFIGRTDAEAETPILLPPVVKNWLIGKDPDAGKDRRQKKKGMTEDEMVGWHHQLDEHEFEQALGIGDGQGSLACCSPWGRKELGMTERLSWTGTENLFF